MKRLKKVYCSFIPFKGYVAVTVLCWMVIRKEYKELVTWIVENHENIHYAQERELWYVGFYLMYVLFYLRGLWYFRNHRDAYHSIPFEQEAYKNEGNSAYLNNRESMAWKKFNQKEYEYGS